MLMTKKPKQDKFFLLSLGCSKNSVDSESMAQLLQREGMAGCSAPVAADTLIVNT
ncbi:MAG: 30S ribosomal protein S12 methylthiotransferase RimO, partial [Chloroflexi bacterium]|nr:30S ribosomal protein S12 methylthiotransferase RimO [Chloroflexota bacterium]